MATLQFKPDELLKKMRIKKYAADELIKNNKQEVAANTERMAADWYKNWKKQNGIPGDSNALPPVDSVPTWARPHLFPRAEATPRDGMKIAGGGGGGYTTTNGGIVGLDGSVYYNDNGVLRYDGTYDEKIHGEIIPGIGLDQANNTKARNGLKISQT